MVVTVFLLVVMVLGYGGIVYGTGGYSFLFLAENRHYSAGFVFALTAWAGVAAAAYLLNALFSERLELDWIVLVTIPGALVPALLVAAFGISQRRRALEELAR